VTSSSFSRIVTTFAVGFLTLDALLFALAERFIPAAVCAVAAVLVVLAWRRYRRVMSELAEARRDMKREAESIRALLETHFRN
jgi:sensor domain CHASE-containing protein